jgi:D-alanyl-D-alanine carboxypeptidase
MQRRSEKQRNTFFYSIMTAVVVGVGLAYGGIFGIQFASKHTPRLIAAAVPGPHVESGDATDKTTPKTSQKLANEAAQVGNIVDEEDADPTFISKFSRGFTYTAAALESEDKVEELLLTAVNPKISAIAYSVSSLDKGNTLVAKDDERLLPIASVTKLVTAVVAKKVFDENDTIEITSKELSTEGNSGKLRLGEKYKVKEILYPLLMVSSNDAAEAIAQTYDSLHTKGAFVREMNNWTNSIGAYRTYFKDPSGLSPSNVSTAYDITIIAKWIKENQPDIFDITLTKTKTIRTHTWVNPTHFLNLSSYDGGKNGYTTEANLTSVSLFSFGSPKRYYSVVLLGSKQRDADTLAVLNKALK